MIIWYDTIWYIVTFGVFQPFEYCGMASSDVLIRCFVCSLRLFIFKYQPPSVFTWAVASSSAPIPTRPAACWNHVALGRKVCWQPRLINRCSLNSQHTYTLPYTLPWKPKIENCCDLLQNFRRFQNWTRVWDFLLRTWILRGSISWGPNS